MSSRVCLSKDSHLEYFHLCGLKGREVDEASSYCKLECPRLRDCLLSHSVGLSPTIDDDVYEDLVSLLVYVFRGRQP